MDVSEMLCASSPRQHQQLQQIEPLSSEMSLTPTLQQQETAAVSPPPALTPTTPRTTTHTPREIPTMYILDDLYDDDYIDQFNSYNTTTPTETPDPSVSIQLAPCPICSRTFNPVALRKHVGICEKMATKKRNIFDSSRQRREGTDLATYPLPKNFGLSEKSSSTTLTRTKSERGHSPNPQQQVASPIMQRKKPTEEFIRSTARTSMRKLSTSSATEGMTASTNFARDRLRSSERSLTRRGIQPLPSEQCPHCDRCFGIKAYDRHVEWCKEKALQASIKQQASTRTEENIAKARLEARTKYRAPCLKTKRSINRDKYSGLAGDENEDSPKSLKIGNRTHDNSLMSMSMTSSITSERKITKQTGNINEASTVPAKTSIPSEAPAFINNRKRSRDKSQTPPQPKSDYHLPASDPIANFEIQMPDFRLMGEKMTTSDTNNKKIKGKSLMKVKEKPNVPAHVPVTTTTTTTKLKQQTKVIAAAKSNHHRMEADVMHAVTKAHKKTPSDLSLKSMRQLQFMESSHAMAVAHTALGRIDNDHVDVIRPQPEERSSPVRKVDLSKSLTFYASPHQEIGKVATAAKSLKSTRKESLKPESKMTMEEYFVHKDNKSHAIEMEVISQTSKEPAMIPNPVEDECHDEILENRILGSKKVISSRNNKKKSSQKLEKPSKEYKGDDLCLVITEDHHSTEEIPMSRKLSIKPNEHFIDTSDKMIMQQSYTRGSRPNDHEVFDNEEEDDDELDENEDDFDYRYFKEIKGRTPSKNISKSQPKEHLSENNLKCHFKEKPTKPTAEREKIPPVVLQSTKNCRKSETTEESLRKLQSKENFVENEKISRRSKDLSDDNVSMASTPKRSNQIPHTPTKETLQKAYEALEKLELSDKFPDKYEHHLTDSDVVDSKMKRQRFRKCLDGNPDLNYEEKCLTDLENSDDKQHQMDDMSALPSEEDAYEENILKVSTSKADTFIKTDSDSEGDFETPPENQLEITRPNLNIDNFRSQIPNFRSFSPPKRMPKAQASLKEKDNKAKNRAQFKQTETLCNTPDNNPETPRVAISRTSRASTPPPRPPCESLNTTPRSTASLSSYQKHNKLETSPIKSLSICRPKRKKVVRQSVSSTSALPMKALPLTKETIEIYGVSSAPHMSHNKKSFDNQDNNSDGGDEQEEEDETVADDETDQHNVIVHNEFEGGILVIPDKEIWVIKEPPPAQLKRSNSFTISGLPDNYDPFLSAKRQLEELCSPTDSPTTTTTNTITTPQTPQLPSLPATPAASANKMSTSLTLSSSTTLNSSSPMTTSQTPQTSKTPTLARSSSFRRTGSLRCPRRSPLLTQRVPLFAQKHRPTIQRGLSDEGPISTNFMKPEEYDEMPVRSVCVNDYAVTKSPRVVRRDTSASNRKQPLKLNINAANAAGGNTENISLTPNAIETESAPNTSSKYVSKTDSLAVFLKYEHELEKLNKATNAEIKKEVVDENANPTSAALATTNTATSAPLAKLDGPLNAKELKDKSNNLSKQNSAKNIKADLPDHLNETNENCEINLINNNTTTNNLIVSPGTPAPDASDTTTHNIYSTVRLTPISKPSTPLIAPNTHLTKPSTPVTKPSTPLTKPTTPLTKPTTPLTQPLTPLNTKTMLPLEQIKPQLSQKPVALSSLFGAIKTSEERKNCVGSDYIDPKLINKCDNLPVNLNKLRNEFKNSDSDNSEVRQDHFSSSSSESSAPPTKFLPSVKPDNVVPNNLNQNLHQNPPQHPSLSQRNSAEGRNLLKRRIRLGRNQFLYDASPEADSCLADDEANRSSMECDHFIKEHEKAFDRLSAQMNPLEATPFTPPPFIPSLPAEFEDFDFEEFLSSFENDEEQFPLFKDCREFLLNRTSKKQRSMLMPNSNVNVAAQSKKSVTSPQQTFPPLTPQHNIHSRTQQQQHFQFPNLPQHPKGLFDSFSLNNRATKNRYNDNPKMEDVPESHQNQKREIFISIETEQNDLDKSSISPNSIRHLMGNPQCVVEVEVDAADNKFSKISDDDEQLEHGHTHLSGIGSRVGGNHFNGHFVDHHLPNVQLNNAKNLIQKMQEDFRQLGEEMSANLRHSVEQQKRASAQGDMTMMMMNNRGGKVNKATGTPSGDAYADSDELSSLDGYPLSSPNSRLGVSSKTSADSAYGSLSRQRSSELTNPRNSSRNRPLTSSATTGNAVISRPLTEERSRQLSASSSSSSEHALPPIGGNNNYQKQQHQQQQHLTQLYNNNNNNNNNVTNDLDEMLRYERNNNFDVPIHPTISPAGLTPTASGQHHHSASNHETPMSSSTQLYASNSTMNSSMKMSKFCHECGSKFLLEQAKFCMDCGVKRICL